ncbi:Capsular polysaccharide synthesis enzyme Cap5K [Staphylococcus equorum subsp. equorum]|uniref:capsular biosynthesis protein n=1 Tax=Staphylococcus equorum TaxID=246432 RepID=UPI000623C75E|nr:capsular biosynthesis protein [Staphylococcus equorum]ANR67282.1 capsular biosynthesis protein [Staphylococcus equorum]KKI54822.1 Capsular polysaccharide synthesis enzyme Cap5K [Staphylococcus equorum subsp. equorum]PTE24803.1 capsular biosynthesis protein [Staphylococcus equorum]
MTKYKFFIDSSKTIASSLLVAFGLQLIAYPFIINEIGNNQFGEILTIYTLMTISSVVIGNTLNNIRLINVKYYSPDNIYMIFFKILFMSIILESVILSIILNFYFHLAVVSIFYLIIINILMCLRVYLLVFYRMKLEYNKIFWVSFYQFIGIVLGIIIYKFVNIWELLFLSSEILPIIYILYTLNYKIKSKKLNDSISKSVLKDYLYLLSNNLLNNIVMYLDRLILLPLIGGTAVTLSYLATFLGKIIASFLYPINNVILSYISLDESQNKFKQYMMVTSLGSILSIFVLAICYPLTLFIIENIYMQNSDDIKNYIIIGNSAILVGVIGNMIQSLNIKYVDLRIQSIFQFIYSIVVILLSIILTIKYGVLGFFLSLLIGNIFKGFSLLLIGYKYSNSKEFDK